MSIDKIQDDLKITVKSIRDKYKARKTEFEEQYKELWEEEKINEKNEIDQAVTDMKVKAQEFFTHISGVLDDPEEDIEVKIETLFSDKQDSIRDIADDLEKLEKETEKIINPEEEEIPEVDPLRVKSSSVVR